MDHQTALTLLEEELRHAEKHLQDTSDYLDLAIQMNRNPGPTPETQLRVKLAARAYRRALDDRIALLSRLGPKPAEPGNPQRTRFNPEAEPNGTSRL